MWGDSCERLGYVERPYATGLVNVRLFRAQQRARHTNYPRLARKKTRANLGHHRSFPAQYTGPAPKAESLEPYPYQFNFSANWNCRGSYAAVGCPAFVNNGLTADTLKRFAMLNMSTMKSMFTRSPK